MPSVRVAFLFVACAVMGLALGCSTAVLPTPDCPVDARNMDWWPEGPLARASYLIRCTDGPDWKFTSAGFPGATGVVSGLSSRGLADILNAVTTPQSAE